MKLLVSVVDDAEARLAVAGGVDVVDVKNPAEGSLGAPAPGVIARVRSVVPAEMPLSAAIGDLPCLPGTAALAALGAARSGAAYAKIGLWGSSTTEEAVAVLRAAQDAVEGDAAIVAVTYADGARVPSRPLPPRQLVAAARRAGVAGCLLDTAVKDGRGLLSWLAPDELAELVAEAHDAGLEMALAGELRARGPADDPHDRRGHRRRALGRVPGRAAHRPARPRAHRAAASGVRRERAGVSGVPKASPARACASRPCGPRRAARRAAQAHGRRSPTPRRARPAAPRAGARRRRRAPARRARRR